MDKLVRKAPEEIRDVITRAALASFCVHGYDRATLQEIAARVGLTRGAVLHHFNSKAALFEAVVAPCERDLAQLLDTAVVADPPERSEQEQMISAFTRFVLEHRKVVGLLVRDIGASGQLESARVWSAHLRRLTTLLTGSQPEDGERIRTIAALGAILHPAATGALTVQDSAAAASLVGAGMAFIGVSDRAADSQVPR
jgi:AcrR family transcriptional regulator